MASAGDGTKKAPEPVKEVEKPKENDTFKACENNKDLKDQISSAFSTKPASNAPAFSFGTTKPTSTSIFSFGTTSTQSQPSAATLFGNNAAAKPSTGTFTFGAGPAVDLQKLAEGSSSEEESEEDSDYDPEAEVDIEDYEDYVDDDENDYSGDGSGWQTISDNSAENSKNESKNLSQNDTFNFSGTGKSLTGPPTFSFGNTLSKTEEEKPKPTFNFGKPAAEKSSFSNPFKFGGEDKKEKAPFTFGAPKTDEKPTFTSIFSK